MSARIEAAIAAYGPLDDGDYLTPSRVAAALAAADAAQSREIERLREALRNMLHCYDDEIANREPAPDWISAMNAARAALGKES